MSLSVYKKGQGTAARGLAGVLAVLVGTWAGRQMWMSCPASWPIARVVLTAIVAFAFGVVPLYLVLFSHRVVDVLIETQQEMRKVAWSSRSEVIGSTMVVIVVVTLVSLFILGTDMVILNFNRLIGLY